MGTLFVTGIGPGNEQGLTAEARAALEASEILCGYRVYVDLVSPWFPGRETVVTSMGGEAARCRRALELAQAGKTVALLSSGDPEVYGLAGLALEIAPAYPGADVQIVAGVTAALSGGAVLGAPLGHDFCCVSLSDLLTPWAVVEKRLRCAGEGDFALCLYNPASHRRKHHLRRSCEVLLPIRGGETVCGWVRNIGREGQTHGLLSLAELRDFPADMFTTVFIGSSATRIVNGRMVTPRGYPL